MIPVHIVGLHLDARTGASILLLGEIDETTRVLPIFIGPTEARAIALAAQNVTPPRPFTHDLLIDVIEALDAELVRVEITELRDGTFLAELEVSAADETHRISTRPSDGIALAVRRNAPIFVSSEVLDDAAVAVAKEGEVDFDEEEVESIVAEFQNFLATATPDDFEPMPGDDDSNDSADE